jgi:hypothetical protein
MHINIFLYQKKKKKRNAATMCALQKHVCGADCTATVGVRAAIGIHYKFL